MAEPLKFRKRPVEIEAIQLTDDADWLVIAAWCGNDRTVPHTPGDLKDQLAIPTRDSVMWASIGDWIIRNANGEFSVCKPTDFEATYEPVDGELADSGADPDDMRLPEGRPAWLVEYQSWPCGRCGKEADGADPHDCRPVSPPAIEDPKEPTDAR